MSCWLRVKHDTQHIRSVWSMQDATTIGGGGEASAADLSHTELADLQPSARPLPAPGEAPEHENHLRCDHFLSSHAVDHSHGPGGHSLQLHCLQLRRGSGCRLMVVLVSAIVAEHTVTSLRSARCDV